MSSKRIRGGRAEIEAVIRDKLSAGLKGLQNRLRNFAAGASRIGGGAVAAATAGLTPIAFAVGKFLKVGDNLDKMSARTGVAVEDLSTLGFVANETGGDMGSLEKMIIGLQRTTRNAERGLSTATDSLETLGLKADDLKNKAPADGIKLIAERLQTIDPQQRAAIAMEIFGKAGQKMLPMLNLGADGIDNLQSKARDLGVEMSGKDASAAAQLTDRLFELKEIVTQTAVQLGAALAPTLIRGAELLQRAAVFVLNFVKNNHALVVGITAGLAALAVFGGAMLTASVAAIGLSMAISGVVVMVKILVAIVGAILSPIGLLVALVLAAGGAFLYFSGVGGQVVDFLQGKLGALLEWGKLVFGGIYDAIATGDWDTAGKILWTSLRIAWLTGVGWLTSIWLEFKFGFLNIVDSIVVAFRTAWQYAIDFVANGILTLIDQANNVSETLTGNKIVNIDVDGERKRMRQSRQDFQNQVARGFQQRVEERERSKQETLSRFDTSELQSELEGLAQSASDARQAQDFLASPEGQAFLIGRQLQFGALGGGTPVEKAAEAAADTQEKVTGSQSLLSTFSADVLSSFRAQEKKEQKQIADATAGTEDNTAEMLRIMQEAENNGSGLVIS